IVGLTTTPQRLVEVRRNRLLSLAQTPDTTYVDSERVRAEVAKARRMFADQGWPVIDVTRKAIEETAAAILNLMIPPEDGELAAERTEKPGETSDECA
ncbi:MAG: kinase/pyrophosphorylase, partial [Pseudomonadota bacterium]